MFRTSNVCLVSAAFLMGCLLVLMPSSLLAAPPDGSRAEPTASGMVSPALAEALEHHERVGASVYFLSPSAAGEGSTPQQSSAGAQVSPLVLELAQAMLPGKLSLVHYNSVESLRGTVDARAVQILLRNPQVLSIDLDEAAPLPDTEDRNVVRKTTCVPSSTVACVQGGRFSLSVSVSGSLATVATSSSESAAFWFYDPANWEVVAKVLNGCGVNNHFWIFGAGATGNGYLLEVGDTTRGTAAKYNGGSGGSCPIVDTGNNFPCS